MTWKAGVLVGLWVYAQHGFDTALPNETPGGALAAIVALTLFLIYVIMSSLASSD